MSKEYSWKEITDAHKRMKKAMEIYSGYRTQTGDVYCAVCGFAPDTWERIHHADKEAALKALADEVKKIKFVSATRVGHEMAIGESNLAEQVDQALTKALKG